MCKFSLHFAMLVIFLNKFPTPTSDSYVSPTNLKLLLQASNEIACEWQDCMAGFVYLDGLRCEDRGFPQLKTTALRLRRQENRRRADHPTWRNTFW